MPRLIDAEKLKAHYSWWAGGSREMTMNEAQKIFDVIIDVQPEAVVRCHDCKHFTFWCSFHETRTDPDGFCSWGEREGDETKSG